MTKIPVYHGGDGARHGPDDNGIGSRLQPQQGWIAEDVNTNNLLTIMFYHSFATLVVDSSHVLSSISVCYGSFDPPIELIRTE